MSEQHQAYLGLGSNIEAAINLPAAVRLLNESGSVEAVSSVWESRAVGSGGPNFLNACVRFVTPQTEDQLKEETLGAIEKRLGRVRGPDVNAPRTIDLDILMFDGRPINPDRWLQPFVLVPLADLAPTLTIPGTTQVAREVADRAQRDTWIVKRPDVVLA